MAAWLAWITIIIHSILSSIRSAPRLAGWWWWRSSRRALKIDSLHYLLRFRPSQPIHCCLRRIINQFKWFTVQTVTESWSIRLSRCKSVNSDSSLSVQGESLCLSRSKSRSKSRSSQILSSPVSDVLTRQSVDKCIDLWFKSLPLTVCLVDCNRYPIIMFAISRFIDSEQCLTKNITSGQSNQITHKTSLQKT